MMQHWVRVVQMVVSYLVEYPYEDLTYLLSLTGTYLRYLVVRYLAPLVFDGHRRDSTRYSASSTTTR